MHSSSPNLGKMLDVLTLQRSWETFYNSEITSHDQPEEEHEPLLLLTQQTAEFNECDENDLNNLVSFKKRNFKILDSKY